MARQIMGQSGTLFYDDNTYNGFRFRLRTGLIPPDIRTMSTENGEDTVRKND